MKNYLQLQRKMLDRHLIDFGIQPMVGYVLSVLIFIGGSAFIFFKFKEQAPCLYAGIGISAVIQWSQGQRTDFLKSIFTPPQYFRVRLLENGLTILPFALFLVYKSAFLTAILSIIVALALAFFNFRWTPTFSIPTPFARRPFEFAAGFRQSYAAFLFVYFLCFMAIWVGNFNLGGVSLLIVFMICMGSVSVDDPEFYVWNHAFTPPQYLWGKIKTMILYSTLLAVPIIVSLCVFFPHYWYLMVIIPIVSWVYLTGLILAKYSVFPKSMGIIEIGLFSFCILIPPMLLFVVPFFYSKSVKRLQYYL